MPLPHFSLSSVVVNVKHAMRSSDFMWRYLLWLPSYVVTTEVFYDKEKVIFAVYKLVCCLVYNICLSQLDKYTGHSEINPEDLYS
jgi:hypothetical protein